MFPRQHAELHRLEVRPSMKDPECGRPTAERLKVNFSHCYRNCAWEGGREGLVLRIPQSQGQMKSIHSSFMKCQASWTNSPYGDQMPKFEGIFEAQNVA